MKAGNLKLYTVVFFIFFNMLNMHAEERINLNILQPTFEEEPETVEIPDEDKSNIKSKKKTAKF